ncbi:hypothetical protein EBZ38_13495 [bacterium]|nr:hypothetical protein [bacterium]
MIKNEQLTAGTLSEEALLSSLLEEEDRRRRLSKGKASGTGEAMLANGPAGQTNKGSSSGNKRDNSPSRGGKGSFQKDPNFKGKVVGKDGVWGELGHCPKGYCEGCHRWGHSWRFCFKRPGDQVPKHLHSILGQTEPRRAGPKDKGKTSWSGKGQGSANTVEEGENSPSQTGGAYVVISEDSGDAAKVTADLHFEDGADLGSGWLLDSGASRNFTPHLSDFESDLQEATIKKVRVADGVKLPVCGVGEVLVLGKNNKPILITGVHWVPDMKCRLLSVSHLTKKGAKVSFDDNRCRVYSPAGELDMEGHLESTGHEGLYKVSLPLAYQTYNHSAEPSFEAFQAAVPADLAYRRLMHAGHSTVENLVRHNSVTGLDVQPTSKGEKPPQCSVCQHAKSRRLPFPPVSKTPVTKPLEVVSADLWGPLGVRTIGRKALFVLTLLDYYSRHVWTYQLANKEAPTVLQVLKEGGG